MENRQLMKIMEKRFENAIASDDEKERLFVEMQLGEIYKKVNRGIQL